jgi:deazaflavin-dependent oxidoreductase (nitroreductase family)
MTARGVLVLAGLLAVAPAGRAAGTVPVSQLRTYQDASTIELTTTGRTSGQPRTVTIWFAVDAQGRLYVQSGKGGRTDWYRNLRKTPAVTMRIGELALRGVATPIDDPAEVARVHELFRQKYLRARITAWFGGEIGRGKVVELRELDQLP